MIAISFIAVCASLWVDARKFIAKKMNVVRIRRETSVLDHLRTTSQETHDSLMETTFPSESSQPTLAVDVSEYPSEILGYGMGE